LEKIYQNALVHRLRKQGLRVEPQHPINVHDEDGTLLGEFFADLFVENKLVVELKACKTIVDEHVAQLLGYLRASCIEDGLLINFGSSKLQVKKYVLGQEHTQALDN
jgi:GxxExxY protein